MSNINRIKSSLIDTTKEINFVFNGKKYKGFKGDTLGSALLANNVKLAIKLKLDGAYIPSFNKNLNIQKKTDKFMV